MRLDLYVFCVTTEIHSYSQLDLCVTFYSYFYAHEVLFRKLQITWLFAVRFMHFAWKFHPFQSKRVCSSYCCYADLTIHEFCNIKRRITVTTIVEGLTNKVLWQWKGLQTRCSNTLLDKELMLPFVSIKCLQFCTWNCVSIISYATAYAAKHFLSPA